MLAAITVYKAVFISNKACCLFVITWTEINYWHHKHPQNSPIPVLKLRYIQNKGPDDAACCNHNRPRFEFLWLGSKRQNVTHHTTKTKTFLPEIFTSHFLEIHIFTVHIMPLIIITGIPCSGKSTVTKKIQTHLKKQSKEVGRSFHSLQ